MRRDIGKTKLNFWNSYRYQLYCKELTYMSFWTGVFVVWRLSLQMKSKDVGWFFIDTFISVDMIYTWVYNQFLNFRNSKI